MEPQPASSPSSLPADFPLGDHRVRPALNRVDSPGGAAVLEPRVMEVLVYLARRRGEVVSKEELVREVWGGRFVSDDVVWRSIAELRRALGDDARRPRVIETVARRGYRLLPEEAGPRALPPLEAEDASTENDLPRLAPATPLASEAAAAVPESPRLAAAPSPVFPVSPAALQTRRALRTRAALALALLLLAAGVAAALFADRAVSRSAPPPRLRLAVLPFTELGAAADEPYWAEGLTDELISRLGALEPRRLGVVGRWSVSSLDGSGRDLRKLGRELGVDYVLEGSVRRETGRVRVAARLLQVSDQTAVWSESLDLTPRRALELQGYVAGRVAEALALELLPERRAALAQAAAVTPEALDAQLRGRYLLQRGTPEAVTRSVPLFEKAAAAAPDSPAAAPAWAGLADALHLLALSGALPPGEGYPRAEAAARRALALDPGLADTRAVLASIRFRHHWDWPGAEAEFRRALADNPGSAVALHDFAWFLVAMGRFEEGLTAMRRAREVDPLSLRANADVGWVLYRAGRGPEAIAEMRRLLDLEPAFGAARLCLERALIERGALAEALGVAREGLVISGMEAGEVAKLTAGSPGAALRRISQWRQRRLEERGRTGYVSPFFLAAAAAEVGDRTRALAELERAFSGRDPSLPTLAVDPVFAAMRGDRRFREMVSRLRLPQAP